MDSGDAPQGLFLSWCSAPAIISGALMAFTLSLGRLIVTYFTRAETGTLDQGLDGKVGLNPIPNTISTVFIVAGISS
jgi:ABC-type spermidine/putrescine transport system permease subunit II